MRNSTKLVSAVVVLVAIFILGVSSASAAALQRYDDDFIRFSYPSNWTLEKNYSRTFTHPETYSLRIPTSESRLILNIRVFPTLQRIEKLRNKYPNNGYRNTGIQRTTTRLSGFKAYRVISNYKDNQGQSNKSISLWTVKNNEPQDMKEILVEYDVPRTIYNRYVNDVQRVMSSIRLK